MFVKLVVIDEHAIGDPDHFAKCSGAEVVDQLAEVLVGDDQMPCPCGDLDDHSIEGILKEEQQRTAWLQHHYPLIGDNSQNVFNQFMSRSYLAAMVLGSTGWSGYNEKRGYWTCGVADLSPEGKALYDLVAKLYPKATLHLLTFLDT